MLLILSLDTTSRAGSVAVVRDDVVIAEVTGDPAITHGQRLPGELRRALETAAVTLDQIDLLAVAAGPGSFTGLRVGIASMQGLACSRGLKVVPVSTLEALARDAARQRQDDALVAPWIDAQRGEVFATLYTAHAQAVLQPPSSARPAETLCAWRESLGAHAVLFTGDGAVRYREAIATSLGAHGQILEPVPLLAAPVGRIAALEPHRAVSPHAVVPIYVRRSDAELARDRQQTSDLTPKFTRH
ncbi:MAG: tRNA (adenosine(37)-N6)-threonylcarbamoyltransferase complex dimerization subunit type 1 TsaB [Vicinamibacterales bacterium]